MLQFGSNRTLAFRANLRRAIWGLIACGGWALVSAAEEPAKASEDDLREILGAAERYELFLGPDRRLLQFQREPVLRWPNPTRETPEGCTFVWTLDGRPEAIACIWKHEVLSFAFHSLSTSKLIAQDGDQAVWRPDSSGIRLENVANASPPAATPTKRLSQMKDLARLVILPGLGPRTETS